MGSSSSKSKKSYKVETAGGSAETRKAQSSPAPAHDDKTKIKVTPPVVNALPAPEWINETQFVDILKQCVPQFAQIRSFKVKPAMGAGENYATLMLRVSIEAELTDKTVKPISFMMKVAHDTPEMQQMLEMGNFFEAENEAYIGLIPKLEELYKSKGLDVTLSPRAYRFTDALLLQEPRLKNTVVMHDLGQDGFKNVNRQVGLNMEQTKMVLRKLAQYHAGAAAYQSVHGPFKDCIMNGMFGSDPEKAMAFMDTMMATPQKMFLENLASYENCAQYHDKLKTYFSKMKDLFLIVGMPKPEEFNCITHGDCWVNNFLFKFDESGKLQDMRLVDLQNPRYCHPSSDVLYFIITSVHMDYKLSSFDYLIKYYHDQLTEHLRLLDYKKPLPKLVDMQMDMYKYGCWAVMACYLVLPAVVLDPTELATFENFLGESAEGENFKRQMYTNKRYKECVEKILPWLDNRGLLEAYEPPNAKQIIEEMRQALATAKATAKPAVVPSAGAQQDSGVPSWVNSNTFKELLQKEYPDFKETVDFRVKKATVAGDNYSSEMLSVDIDYKKVNDQLASTSFMLKLPPTSGLAAGLLDLMLTFKKEMAMYNEVIPQLEQLFKQAGHPVVFGPKSYKLPNGPKSDHIILENLRPAGFKNGDRLKGLSIHETEKVLAKLALLHAASAHIYVTKGKYPDCLDKSLYNETTKPIFDSKESKLFLQKSLEGVKVLKGSEDFAHKVGNIFDDFFNLERKAGTYDENGFNVINHGDCWTNNIMFNYNEKGEVKDTLFVDFQRSSFNTPAIDLYYFLLSSPSFDIKIEKFDYFVRFYHTELKRNLELLKYPKHIPTLMELHESLLKAPMPAVTTVTHVMPVVLLEPTENASIETMMKDNEEGSQFKQKMYGNERYLKHAEAILPWLNHRGLLDVE